MTKRGQTLRNAKAPLLVFTVEHARPFVPQKILKTLFPGRLPSKTKQKKFNPLVRSGNDQHASGALRIEDLKTHVSFDLGALKLASLLRQKVGGQLHSGSLSRLLVDFNRSPRHPQLIGPWGQRLTSIEQLKLIDTRYNTYRDRVFRQVQQAIANPGVERVLLLSIHSFTPVWQGRARKTDLGILFRPNIAKELAMAQTLRNRLRETASFSKLNIHFNRPYRGHTNCLSNEISDRYLGSRKFCALFLEFNQNLLANSVAQRKRILDLSRTLRSL